MTDLPGAGAAMAATPGATLASARAASGLSIVDVAAQMRISPRQVQSIEADRYDELPGAVFVRGFVRNYARLLGVDPVPLLRALEPELGQDVPLRAHEIAGTLPVPVRRNHLRLWIGVFAVVIAVVVGAGAYELWRARSERLNGPASSAPSGSPAPAARAGPPSTAAGATIELAPERLADATPPFAPESEQTASPAVGTALPDATAASKAGAARIGIEFARESWIEVRDREGTVIYSGTGQPNTVRSLEVRTPVEVVVGNASGVRITYNEQPFDVNSHAVRNIARFTLE